MVAECLSGDAMDGEAATEYKNLEKWRRREDWRMKYIREGVCTSIYARLEDEVPHELVSPRPTTARFPLTRFPRVSHFRASWGREVVL